MATFERDVLDRFIVTTLQDDEAFCVAIGEIQGEFLAGSPLRDKPAVSELGQGPNIHTETVGR